MMNFVVDWIAHIKKTLEKRRAARRWSILKARGMRIGKDVFLPRDIWIDISHCFLISIGDRCRFGPNCAILAHDASPNEFIDAGKIGRVNILESCSFGYGTVILPNVKIGPRVVVAASSVISNDIPPDSVAAGNPAKVVASLRDYLRYHRLAMRKVPVFPYDEYGQYSLSDAKRREILRKLNSTFGYIKGGYSAFMSGERDTATTP